jgi:hypothetical protein
VVGWRVDGVPVQVHVWRFAGGWTAFTDAVAGVYLSVVGVGPGTGPEDLSFAALRDGSAYHFDLHGPLSLETAEASAEAAGVPLGSPPSCQRHDWHPDQLQLIRELGLCFSSLLCAESKIIPLIFRMALNGNCG